MHIIRAMAITQPVKRRIKALRAEYAAIIPLSDYIRQNKLSAPAVTNAARRQTIAAFREKEVWKIGRDYAYGKSSRMPPSSFA